MSSDGDAKRGRKPREGEANIDIGGEETRNRRRGKDSEVHLVESITQDSRCKGSEFGSSLVGQEHRGLFIRGESTTATATTTNITNTTIREKKGERDVQRAIAEVEG